MPTPIDYFYVPQSPWTYLGHARFCALVERYALDMRLTPCDIGRVFAVSGGLPLAKRAQQRQAYRLVELARFRDHLEVPLNLEPRHFPVVGDAAARLLIATAELHGAARALLLAGAIGRAVWADERDIADVQVLTTLVGEVGLDAEPLLVASQSDRVAARYEANTQEAIERGVFGAPTYILEGELFWGQDRLDFLERALRRRAA